MEESITVEEAIELLFNRESIRAAILAEDEADCDVSAGLDWGSNSVFAAFMQNPALLGRMTTLRLSLDREIHQMLKGWNLGVGETIAVETAASRLLSRLQSPQQQARTVLEAILMRDDLYTEELISDALVLQELLSVLYDSEDWNAIATVAGNAVREEILVHVAAP